MLRRARPLWVILSALTACALENPVAIPRPPVETTDLGARDDVTTDDAALPEDLGADASPPADQGAPVDTGSVDGGPMDAGPIDTGVIDTGVDTGVIDTGPVDTGPVDTGVIDSGPADTGPVDTGPVDTGPVDTGPPTCGRRGLACCNGTECSDNSACNLVGVSLVCTPCGDPNGACCRSVSNPCPNAPGHVCSLASFRCVNCGTLFQRCCDGGGCDPFLRCVSGVCRF